MRLFFTVVLISIATTTFAQVQSRPTDAPIVSAEHDAWYVNGDPVQFAGNTYYRGGAAVFFDGNRMVRSGSFNGIPLYSDATLEPFSIVYVPIGRGLMQPYELPRSGDLAGTTGSRAPSFPVSALPNGWRTPMAPSAPTSLEPLSFDSTTREATSGATARAPVGVVEAGEEGEAAPAPIARPAATPADIEAARERVWIEYNGQKWVPAGPAIPMAGSGLVKSGEYAGFPVLTRQDDARIYVPAIPGLVTPYQPKR